MVYKKSFINTKSCFIKKTFIKRGLQTLFYKMCGYKTCFTKSVL